MRVNVSLPADLHARWKAEAPDLDLSELLQAALREELATRPYRLVVERYAAMLAQAIEAAGPE